MNSTGQQIQLRSLDYFKTETIEHKRSLFNIKEVRSNDEASFNTLTTCTRLEHFELLWIFTGKAVLTIDTQRNELTDNVIYFLVPGQTRQLQQHADMLGYLISVSADFLSLSELQLPPQSIKDRKCMFVYPDEKSSEEMLIIVKRMNKELENYYLLRSEILKGFLKIFMIYFSRKIESTHEVDGSIYNGRGQEITDNFMFLVKKHFASKKKVEDYASELCVTPNYLNWVVKKFSGFPASHHIQQHVILEAKKKALYSMLRMKEIAIELGFNDYAHFSKYFKNYAGTSFSQFRKMILR